MMVPGCFGAENVDELWSGPLELHPLGADDEQRCPLLGEDGYVCQASSSELRVDGWRSKRRCSEDFDSCARFLAYLLRHSRPKRYDSDWMDAAS